MHRVCVRASVKENRLFPLHVWGKQTGYKSSRMWVEDLDVTRTTSPCQDKYYIQRSPFLLSTSLSFFYLFFSPPFSHSVGRTFLCVRCNHNRWSYLIERVRVACGCFFCNWITYNIASWRSPFYCLDPSWTRIVRTYYKNKCAHSVPKCVSKGTIGWEKLCAFNTMPQCRTFNSGPIQLYYHGDRKFKILRDKQFNKRPVLAVQ